MIIEELLKELNRKNNFYHEQFHIAFDKNEYEKCAAYSMLIKDLGFVLSFLEQIK